MVALRRTGSAEIDRSMEEMPGCAVRECDKAGSVGTVTGLLLERGLRRERFERRGPEGAVGG
jgi:hypothetical protein